jgi:hypothetical protein
MEILITKNTSGDHILSCKRKDGTITWTLVSNFFILHDLCHYTIETTLVLKKAFFGMLARGTDITQFDVPKDQRKIEFTTEALFAEHLVNLMVIDYTQGRMDNLLEIFKETYDDASNELLNIVNEEKLQGIRENYATLLQKWKVVPEAESLQLIFEE